ncbi:MAG: PIN domain-containing protein [Calditrichaceae bacterium]|nr:PIN domain-containing protein [Calditrichia bacterium]NUQ40864.1 PIN domain-containing protein [Calditrichaceae bacterium]
MNVIVDTSIWSLALRRKEAGKIPEVLELKELIRELRAKIIGPIRQEILSGVREERQFQVLRERLRAFEDLEIISADYERAAEFFNTCRKKGVQGSNTDFLICAVSERYQFPILSTDKDFQNFSARLPIRLHSPRQFEGGEHSTEDATREDN